MGESNESAPRGAFVVRCDDIYLQGEALRVNLTFVSFPTDGAQGSASHTSSVSHRVRINRAHGLMSVIFLLISASALVASLFLGAFIWAVRKGQYDDDRSPAVRMLHDPPPAPKSSIEVPELKQATNRTDQ